MVVTVVLVGVEHPGNLGAVARAMKNFGFAKLLLIDQKCSPKDDEARNRAKWAGDILDGAMTGSLDSLRDFDLVIGTSAILGSDDNLPRTPLTPGELAGRLATVDGSIALLFGRESDGLRNEEIARCDFLVTIPANTQYAAMNLSHAVAILLYELSMAKYTHSMARRFPLLQAPEKAQIRQMVQETLDGLDFTTLEKRRTQELLWKRLIGKAALTQREGMALMGFFRKLQR